MTGTLRILLVDDNPDDRMLAIRALRREFGSIEPVEATNAEELAHILDAGNIDLVITDYRIRWTTGLDVLREVKRRWPNCPVIMFTATGTEEIAVAAMKSGLDDYVLKSPKHFARLPAVVRQALRRAQERRALEIAEARYQDLFNRIPIGVYRATPDGHFLEANPALFNMLGYPAKEDLLHTINRRELFVNPQDYDHEIAILREHGILRGFETQLRRKDGTVIWVRDTAHATHDPSGEILYIEGTLEEFTAQKQAEETRDLLFRAIEQSGDGVIITDPSSQIQYVNPAIEQMSGYTREELLGQTPRVFKSGQHDEAFYKQLWETITHGETWSGRIINRNKEGQLYHVEATISPVYDSTDRLTHYIGVQRDITERLKLEQRLIQAEKMEAIGRLAGSIAHDFNNILTAIQGYVSILLEDLPPNIGIRDDLEEIDHATKRAAALTRQLLTFSRRQPISPVTLDLNEVIRDIERLLRRLIGEHIELAFNLAPDLPPIQADRHQLEQVILNLSLNARDAMPDGGTLSISTTTIPLDETYTKSHPEIEPGHYVMLAVSDTGTGMDEEILSHLFEPFFTTKERDRGTGLGLATVYSIVKQNKGHIEVYSELGFGSTFKIYFPISSRQPQLEPTQEEKQAHLQPTPSTEGKTILVVEDEELVRELLQRTLERSGLHILTTSNPEEALQIATNLDEPIHLVITDIIMPKMNGPELIQHLRSKQPKLKVLYISGYTADTINREELLQDEKHFLQKPFTPATLLQKVQSILSDT